MSFVSHQLIFLSPMCGPCLFVWCWDLKAADPPMVRWQQGLERHAMPRKALAETMAVRIALFPVSRGICRVSQSLRCSPAAHAHLCGSLAATALQALMASSTSSRPAASLDSGMLSATCQRPCRTTSPNRHLAGWAAQVRYVCAGQYGETR